MTHQKPSDPSEIADLRALRDDAVLLLQSVRASLAELLRQVMAGESANLRDLTLKQSELETALKRAFEAEAKYNERSAREDDASQVDYDALRAEIGCRLHRLRSCCQSE